MASGKPIQRIGLAQALQSARQRRQTPQEMDFDDLAGFREDINPRQVEALEQLDSGRIKFLLYGGALGGGKSHLIRWYLARRTMVLNQLYGLKNLPVMLACEDYPSLQDRHLAKIRTSFPDWLGKYFASHSLYGRCFILRPEWGGGIICFRNLDNPAKYASSEWAAIAVDELTMNRYETFDTLRTRLRIPGLPDVEAQFLAGSNPGGIGHGWVKNIFINRQFPKEWEDRHRDQVAFVPAWATDNPFLGPDYWAGLQSLPSAKKKALVEGDWNYFEGQAFPEVSIGHHGVSPIPIPSGYPLLMTMDWGFGKPFSIGWWWFDNDGRAYRFMEWYGCSGVPDEGLRLSDSDIADGIVEREKQAGIWHKYPMTRIAGPDCFQKKPDYKGGGQGDSTAFTFQKRQGLNLIVGDPDRALKIRQVRERLKIPKDGSLPMMVAYRDRCPDFFRTLPDLMMDKLKPEDIDTKMEDHLYDEISHLAMFQPLRIEEELPPPSQAQLDHLRATGRGSEADAWIQAIRDKAEGSTGAGMSDMGMNFAEATEGSGNEDASLYTEGKGGGEAFNMAD